MTKVIYPGPAVEGEARLGPTYYGAHGVGVVVGENDLPDEIAETLIAAGHVTPAAEPVRVPAPRLGRRRSAESNVAEIIGTEE